MAITLKEIFNTDIGVKALIYCLYKNHAKEVIDSLKNVILDSGSKNFEDIVEETVKSLGGQKEGKISAEFFHTIADYADKPELLSAEEAEAYLNKLIIDYPQYFNNELFSSFINKDEFLKKCDSDDLWNNLSTDYKNMRIVGALDRCDDSELLNYLSDDAKKDIGEDYLRNCDDDELIEYLSDDAKDDIGEDYLRNCDNETLLDEISRRMR